MIKLILLILLILIAPPLQAQTDHALEPITRENINWLIPLDRAGIGGISSAFWMPDNRRIAVTHGLGLMIYDTRENGDLLEVVPESGEWLPNLSRPFTDPNRQHVLAKEIVPDARELEPIRMTLWDIVTKEQLGTLSLNGDEVLSALHPDGRTGAVIRHNFVDLYNLATGQRQQIIQGHTDIVAVNFSHDGQYLAISGTRSTIDGNYDNYLMVYDLVNDTPIGVDKNNPVYGIPYFTPDDRQIYMTHPLSLWDFDPATGSLINITGTPAAEGFTVTPQNLDVSYRPTMTIGNDVTLPDGTRVTTGNRYLENGYTAATTTALYTRIGDGQLSRYHAPVVFGVTYSADGQTLYYSASDGTAIDGRETTINGISLVPRPYRLSNTQTALRTADGEVLINYARDNRFTIFNLTLPEEIHDRYSIESSGDLSVSEDRERLAMYWKIANGRPNNIQVMTTRTGETINLFPELSELDLSPDGTLLAGQQREQYERLDDIVVYDVDSGDEIFRMPVDPPRGRNTRVLHAISPDNRLLAVYHSSDSLRLIEIATGEEIFRMAPGDNWRALAGNDVIFSPDGEWLLLGNNNIHSLWRLDDIQREETDAHYQIRDNNQNPILYNLRDEPSTSQPVTREYILPMLQFSTEDGLFAEFNIPPWSPLRQFYTTDLQIPLADDRMFIRGGTVFDTETGEIIRSLPTNGPAFSPDGLTMASFDGTLRVWGVPVPPDDPTTVQCDGAPVPRLQVNQSGMVTATTGPRELRVREYPDGRVIAAIPSGTVVDVVRGPICEDGLLWWGIVADEIVGWSAEAISADDYLIAPTQ